MKARKSRKKLAFFGALFPYLGGKRRLCPLIFREIDRLLPRRHWHGRTFLDGFLGGGSVSLYAKAMGFSVTACDIAERSIVVGEALIENSRTRLTKENVVRILTPDREPAMRVEREMVPAIFTKNVAHFIDRTLSFPVNYTRNVAQVVDLYSVKKHLQQHQLQLGIRRRTSARCACQSSGCICVYLSVVLSLA